MAIDSDLTALKLERSKAMAMARENTARSLSNAVAQKMGPVQAFTGNSYDSSRLLVGTDWAAVAKTVKGELLVTAPARDLVLFGGAADRFGVGELRGLAEHMKGKTDFPLSSTVFRWTAKGFQVAAK